MSGVDDIIVEPVDLSTHEIEGLDLVDTGGALLDDPNRQAVGLDPAWVEGTGGGEEAPSSPLDAMTKDQLVAYAGEHNITVDPSTTKAEIRAAIDAAEAG